MSYMKFAVQGFLKKEVQERQLFQRNKLYKRYFVLDHNQKKMRVHKTNDPNSEFKIFEYKDILSVDIPFVSLDQKMRIQERWSFCFTIKLN